MVGVIAFYRVLLRMAMKLSGMKPQKVEIEEGTTLNFWVPSNSHNGTETLAVVLLHGFAGDGILTWQFQIPVLAQKYRVYVPDLVFFGDSITERWSEKWQSVEFQAACVAKGLKKLGVEKCCVGGFSYGGFVGFKMAEMYSEMVESVVVSGALTELVDSIGGEALERIGGFASWSEYLLPRTEEGVRVLFDAATYKRLPYPKFLLTYFLKEISRHEKQKQELLRALVKKDKDSVIPKYSQKIHLIWGENDRLIKLEVAKKLKMQLGENAELHIIEKAGHLVMLERPFLFNHCFNQILASHLNNAVATIIKN